MFRKLLPSLEPVLAPPGGHPHSAPYPLQVSRKAAWRADGHVEQNERRERIPVDRMMERGQGRTSDVCRAREKPGRVYPTPVRAEYVKAA